jgi:competence protein ComEC
LFMFFRTLPDRETLSIIFCDVGQGDGIYLRFPDGNDMLIDGGPDGSVLECLGKFKPFWDRSISVLLLTHPDLDHFGGLHEVLKRYSIGVFFSTSINVDTPEYKTFSSIVSEKKIKVKTLTRGDSIHVSQVALSWVWPTYTYLQEVERFMQDAQLTGSISRDEFNRNNSSQIIHLRYHSFDAFFTGDADIEVESNYIGLPLSPDGIEILKVPHHGSKTGMSQAFLEWLNPKAAIISNGKKNRYGHPAKETLILLETNSVPIYRTDQNHHIQVITNGKTYSIKTER